MNNKRSRPDRLEAGKRPTGVWVRWPGGSKTVAPLPGQRMAAFDVIGLGTPSGSGGPVGKE